MSARHTPAPAKLPLRAAAHQPFSFLHDSLKHDQDAQFVALTMDVAQGILVALEMAGNSTLTRNMNIDADAGEEDLPLLDATDTERMVRFAGAAAHLLAVHAETRIAWFNEYRATKGAK